MNTDRVAKGILQYHNTPLRGIDKSPAQLATGKQLRDSVPMSRQYHMVSRHWQRDLRQREIQMASTNNHIKSQYDEHASDLRPFKVGKGFVFKM